MSNLLSMFLDISIYECVNLEAISNMPNGPISMRPAVRLKVPFSKTANLTLDLTSNHFSIFEMASI